MKIIWHEGQIINAVSAAAEVASERGAGVVQEKAIRNLQKNIDSNEDSRSEGVLERTILTKPSKFKNGGWIVGVFDDPNRGDDWEDTYGAQAVFVEYGHAWPYQGRKYVGRKNVFKGVQPYPFLRPALKSSKRKINKIFQDEIDKRLK